MEAIRTPTDNELIDQTLRGDNAAFGQLVRRYQDRLFHSLHHLCGGSEDALDVAQDAFVQAYSKLSTFQRTSAFYTWLYRIAFNLFVTRKRRTRSHLSLDAGREVGADPVDPAADPTAGLARQFRAERVRQALAGLTEEHRQVIVLREMEGWSYDKIAELIGLPVGTVRSRLHRARIEMRDLLRDMVEEDVT